MINEDREWLEGGGERASIARPEIVESWRRSQMSGANPDDVTIVPGEATRDCKIARVAVPVLSAMADVLIGANTSLLLSAPDGTMLWRWTENSRLKALLDRRSAVVGTRWNEEFMGTNGLGTALETVKPIMINGEEHFSEALHPFTCAGAPIRHPVTRRVAGVLSVTSLVEHASPLMGPTLLKLAREVEEQLHSDSTLRERELLQHFLAERRGNHNAIIAVNEDVVIANRAGAQLPIDHRALWNQVESGYRDGTDVRLDDSQVAGQVRWRTIGQADSLMGLVIVAESDEPQRTGRRPAAEVDSGTTPVWSELPEQLRADATGSDRVLVTGEVGVGKRALVRESFDGSVNELDCAAAHEMGSERWLAMVRSALLDDAGQQDVVLLSHLEALGTSMCRALGGMLDRIPRDRSEPVLVGTWTPCGDADVEPAVRALVDRFTSEPFEVPPLRKRPDDVLRRVVDQGPGMPSLSAEAVEQAKSHPWPGNHRQLEEFRRWLSRQTRPVIGVKDLPPRWSQEAARARLTAIQAAEADAIAAALRECDGNKAAAAARLGISRSSLYRKMREYRLR